MEREFALQGLMGKLVCQDDGMRCALCAESVDDKRGLYKVYLLGQEGRALLGTLVPEGGMLRMRRSMSIAELKRKGCWPLSGAAAELAFSFSDGSGQRLPEGWQHEKCPERLLFDDILRDSAKETGEMLLRRGKDGFLLAAPYGERKPFPIAPLFCLGMPRQLEGRRYIVYRFDSRGAPLRPHGTEGNGRK